MQTSAIPVTVCSDERPGLALGLRGGAYHGVFGGGGGTDAATRDHMSMCVFLCKHSDAPRAVSEPPRQLNGGRGAPGQKSDTVDLKGLVSVQGC